MATLFEFDLAGDTYRLSISQVFFYVLADGTLLPVLAWPAWCEGCRKFTAAEQFRSVAELQEQLRESEYFAEHPGFIPPDRRVNLCGLPLLRVRLKWRCGRVGPAKCLSCGSVVVTSIDPGPEVDIPGRGKCVARFRGWADMSSPAPQYYTTEGDRTSLTRPAPRARSAT